MGSVTGINSDQLVQVEENRGSSIGREAKKASTMVKMVGKLILSAILGDPCAGVAILSEYYSSIFKHYT